MNAKENGTPYGITITTTPNDLNLPQSAFCYDLIQKAAKWDLSCFDMTDEQLDEYVEKNSSNNFVYVVYTYQELGRSEAWFREQCRGLNNDMGIIKRELLLDWPLSNELSVFSEAQLEQIHSNLKPVKYTMNIDNYIFKCYDTINLRKNYMIGVDVSGGLSKDSSAIVFVDPEDFSVVANFKSNKIDTDQLKNLLRILMTEYFVNAFLIIEKNSFGTNILQTLMKEPGIEPRLLQEGINREAEKQLKDGFVVRKKTKTIRYGVDTTAQSRKLMFELLPSIVAEEYDKINSEDLYQDIAGLERKKNGKIEHGETTHDDTLMAYLIVRYSLYYGQYLKNHGISPLPNPKNVRTTLSSSDYEKIESIIQAANAAEELDMNRLHNSESYKFIADQQTKINKKPNDQVANNMNALLDMLGID